MENSIEIFSNPQFGEIRTAGTAENPLFNANDVCKALGHSNPSKAISDHVDEPDVTKCYTGVVTGKKIDGTDATQTILMTYVNESGLYALIFGSKLPSAKDFKRWVTSEVLPAIRKTGQYQIKQMSRKELALMVIKAEEENERLQLENKEQQKQIEAAKPAVTFTNAFKGAETSCLVGELAKVLRQNGVQIGQNRLFKWLREKHYLGSRGEQYNIPNQEWVERGYFTIKKGVRSGHDGVMHTTTTTKVTSSGQIYFVNMFLNK